MHAEIERPNWVVAEFPSGDALLQATRTAREEKLGDLDIHSPYPLFRAEEALGLKRSKVPLIALCGGTIGGVSGLVMQWWMNAINRPYNIGGRPLFSGAACIPITFECTVLFAALSIFFGLWALCGLPRPYHPAFDFEEFRSQSTHGFWMSVGLATGQDPQKVVERLNGLGAKQVSVVQEQVE